MIYFFFNNTATTEIYTLSLHDALPISGALDPAQVDPPLLGHPSRHRRRQDATVLDPSITLRRGRGLLRWSGCRDRKSTRLNSSHANISYAVFCLKKKNILSAATSYPTM